MNWIQRTAEQANARSRTHSVTRSRDGGLDRAFSCSRKLAPHRLEQRVDSFARRGRYREQRNAGPSRCFCRRAEPIRIVERVDFICGREDRFVGKALARRITPRKERELPA